MDSVKLVAIVSSFNRLGLLKVGLPALIGALRDNRQSCAVVIFDAGSDDGTLEWLREFEKEIGSGSSRIRIEVIQPDADEDSSFSAGVNAACRYAANKYAQCEYYLFYETDNWIRDYTPLQLAVDLLATSPKLAAVGFTVTKHSGEPAGYGMRFPTMLQFLLGNHVTHLLKLDSPKPRWQAFENPRWSTWDVVFTSPVVVRRAAWEASGGFDAKAFPFSDCDADWCWRLRELGWQCAVLDVSGVVHDNREQLSAWSVQRALQFHRARLELLKRHRSRLVCLLKLALFLRHCLEYALLVVLVKTKRRPTRALEARRQLLASVFHDYRTDSKLES